MVKLYVVRHTESFWNYEGIFCGCINSPLDKKGIRKAKEIGEKIKNIKFDLAFCSSLIRTKQTIIEIAYKNKNIKDFVFESENSEYNDLLNKDKRLFKIYIDDLIIERNYGIFTDTSKEKLREKVGEEKFRKIRRGYDVKIKNGETLKDVVKRVRKFLTKIKKLKAKKNFNRSTWKFNKSDSKNFKKINR